VCVAVAIAVLVLVLVGIAVMGSLGLIRPNQTQLPAVSVVRGWADLGQR
jgi:hypothetical protein